jgi:S-adenosylmethionine hydrolase
MSLITLITDFGLEDEYVGLMKGVMLSIHPAAAIVDITHHIGPQDVIQAAYTINASYRYFPEGSIHLVVVDPGVGGRRAIIAAKLKDHIFIAPDNGVLTLLLEGEENDDCIRIDNPEYALDSISHTFHGRDIFAPAAAHLARGIEIHCLGTVVETGALVRLPGLESRLTQQGEIIGKIIAIDHFGNLITNISEHQLQAFYDCQAARQLQIQVGNHKIAGLAGTYESVASLKPLALIGSRGYLEIAINSGRAEKHFKVQKGDRVTVRS